MIPLPTPEEMSAADRAAIEAGTPAEVLMERAGRAVAVAALRALGGRYRRRAVVVCGKGNNGGDGFVAARALAREGVRVDLLVVGDLAPKGAAAWHLALFERAGGRALAFDAGRLARANVIVDAIFGTGFRGTPEGPAADAIDAMNRADAPVVAVDIPSGVDGTTGRVEGTAVRAARTVAIAAPKLGVVVGEGAAHAGEVEVADIGIPLEATHTWLLQTTDVERAIPRRPVNAHKRTSGSVAILAGSDGMSGAALLTARGAVRAGAGYVTLGVTEGVDRVASPVLPEVLTVVLCQSPALRADALDAFDSVVKRADAVAIGPGLGAGEQQRELVAAVLQKVDAPVVVDADGLNVLAGNTDHLRARAAPTVITPHPAELGRLLGRSTEEVQADRVAAARDAASALACVVVLKGHRSVVAEPDDTVCVVPTGGPELATAGTGDVLTGVVGAFLARGLSAFSAAWAAAFVHGAAGEDAARTIGEGVLAWDVAEALPRALAELRRG